MDVFRLVDQEDFHKSKLPRGQLKLILAFIQKYNAAHAQAAQAQSRDMNIHMEAGHAGRHYIVAGKFSIAVAIGWTLRR